MSPLTIFLAVSATWRLTSLLCNEPGPFSVFERIRRWAKSLTRRNRFWRAFRLYDGINCEWCASIWIGTPIVVAWYTLGDIVIWSLLPFALSTWVIVLKYVIQTLAQLLVLVEKWVKMRQS
jgi:hypothetical protein